MCEMLLTILTTVVQGRDVTDLIGKKSPGSGQDKKTCLESLSDVLDLVVAVAPDPSASVDDDPGGLDLLVGVETFSNNIGHPRYLD